MKHIKLSIYIWTMTIIALLVYIIYFSIFPLNDKSNFATYLKPISSVVTLNVFVFFLFSNFLWKWEKFYNWLVPIPNLNGTWKGEIKSNWIDPKTNKRPNSIPVILTIKQSFSKISCVMRTKEMESRSFIADFVIDKDNQILKLVYSYDSVVKEIVKKRSPRHNGTISFDIINNGKELIGVYWTERETTGAINLKFWKKDFIDKFPNSFGEHPVGKIRGEEE